MAAENAGDLADLLKAQGYNFNGDHPNMEALGKLSMKVKARVSAIKTVQKKSIEIEADFYKKVHALEKEFEAKFNAVFEERRKLVVGEREPTDEEAKEPLIAGASEEEIKEMTDSSEEDTGAVGVPDFWLTALKGAETVSDMIQEHDEPILKHLIDITSTVELSPPGFTLFFHFSANPYFKNTVLKKSYSLDLEPEAENPFDYDGPTVSKCTSDTIEWNDGKDITKKVVKKKQKKGANAGKFLTKTVKADSFFNFFDPPQVDENKKNEEDEEDEDEMLLRADFECGQIIRDHVIPRAVLFFTGEAADMDMFDDYDEDEEEEEDEDDE